MEKPRGEERWEGGSEGWQGSHYCIELIFQEEAFSSWLFKKKNRKEKASQQSS